MQTDTTKSNICPICSQPCKPKAKYFPLHYECWRKTEEGRQYLREAKKRSREKNNPGKYPVQQKAYSQNYHAVMARKRRNCKPNEKYYDPSPESLLS